LKDHSVAKPTRTDSAVYEVKETSVGDLNQAELKTCFKIIAAGGAVKVNAMKRDLPRSVVLVLARKNEQIVGVGVIKPMRKGYAARVARNSEFEFPPDTLELGYVAVDEKNGNKGLSKRIVETLLVHYRDRLFATTDSEWMKRSLSKFGFSKKGKEWPGERAMLSYWEGGAGAPVQ
jgi:hypothetical protein